MRLSSLALFSSSLVLGVGGQATVTVPIVLRDYNPGTGYRVSYTSGTPNLFECSGGIGCDVSCGTARSLGLPCWSGAYSYQCNGNTGTGTGSFADLDLTNKTLGFSMKPQYVLTTPATTSLGEAGSKKTIQGGA
jgi:hypothetical protein